MQNICEKKLWNVSLIEQLFSYIFFLLYVSIYGNVLPNIQAEWWRDWAERGSETYHESGPPQKNCYVILISRFEWGVDEGDPGEARDGDDAEEEDGVGVLVAGIAPLVVAGIEKQRIVAYCYQNVF